MIDFIVSALVRLLLNVVVALFAWVALHFAHNADDRVPDLGFWACFWITFALIYVHRAAVATEDA